VCRITDAYAPGVPADRIWNGLPMARLNRRTAWSTHEVFARIPSVKTTTMINLGLTALCGVSRPG
jgi:hypothetical protein